MSAEPARQAEDLTPAPPERQRRGRKGIDGDAATQLSPRLSVLNSFSAVIQIVEELDGSIAMRGTKGPSSDKSMPVRRARQAPTSHR